MKLALAALMLAASVRADDCTLARQSGVQKVPSAAVFTACKQKIDRAKAAKNADDQRDAEDILRTLMNNEFHNQKVGDGTQATTTDDKGRKIKMTTSDTTLGTPTPLGNEIIKYMQDNKIPMFSPVPGASGEATAGNTEPKTTGLESDATREQEKKIKQVIAQTALAGTETSDEVATRISPLLTSVLTGANMGMNTVEPGGSANGEVAPPAENDQQIELQVRDLSPPDRDVADKVLINVKGQLDKSGSNDEAKYRGIGARLNALGRPEDALPSLDRAVQLAPNDPEALAQRARARAMSGDNAGALEDARKAVKLDPKNKLALIIVGHADDLAQSKGKISKGKLDFGAALLGEGLPSGGATPLAARAGAANGDLPLAVSQPGDYERAYAELRPAQGFSPSVEKALRARQMGDKSQALFLTSQAVDENPADAAAWAIRAEIKIDYKNYSGAVADAKRAIDLHPPVALSARALRAKAYAEIEAGDYASALTDLAQAIELEPGNGMGYFYRAMAEEKLGRVSEALRDYDKSDDLDTSLTPLTTEAYERLGAVSNQSQGLRLFMIRMKHRFLFRGMSMALGAGLLLVGLFGAAAARKYTTRGSEDAPRSEPEAATRLDAGPISIAAGTVLGSNYRVTGELGRGGMGVVYDAVDETLQRRVAIKQLQRNEYTTSSDLERFLREARLVARLKHPNLAEIYSVINEGDLFLVFEYVDGQSLDKVLEKRPKLPTDQVRRILSEVASALSAAHAQKIIHRDLKPSNIMISTDERAKIMDFGIAHQSQNGRGTTMTSASGTPPYMAPEQALGSVSPAADLYALAVMAYEMLTGHLPFEGPDFLEQKLRKQFTPPSQRNPDLRRDLDSFFASALDPDPTKRPEDAKDFLRRFDGACAALP